MEFKILHDELTNNIDVIRALLAGVSQEEAQVKPTPETRSILEVVCHFYDEEREDFREHLDFIISTSLNASLNRQNEEWHSIDPDGWITERKYNERNFAEMREKFFDERRKSLDWLKTLAEVDWDTTYTSEYGSMKAGDMLACWVAHDNLHIRQLVELRRNLIERMTKPYDIQYAGDW